MRFDETTGSSSSFTPSFSATSLRDVRLEADDRARRIAEAERLVVGLAADDEHAALLDLFQRLRGGGRGGECETDSRHGRGQKQFVHGSPLLGFWRKA
jgi:hypothetical protein